MKRVLTTLLLVPFAVYCVFFANYWIFVAVAAAMAFLCYDEYSNLVRAHGVDEPGVIGALAGFLLFFDISLIRITGLIALLSTFRVPDLSRALAHAASMVLGAVYIFGAWRCAIDLRSISEWWLFYALAINWVGDIAALGVGKAIGRHKLAPRISPGKTIEGSLGAMALAVIFGLILRQIVLPEFPVPHMIVLSIISNIAGQLGDLVESALKRGAGVKDSGTMLPGHGGWLDRLDSSLFTLPTVFLILDYLNRHPNLVLTK
jgi:phosphatidate cytidylyltransferase